MTTMVTGFTADRMSDIEDSTIVDGEVSGDNLTLIRRDGTTINAGNVRGPSGPDGGSYPVENIWNHGASHDGVADDTPSWLLAIAALPTHGGIIVFPPAAYRGSFEYSGPKRVFVFGYGAKIIPLENSSGLVVHQGAGGGILGCSFEGFHVDGTGVANCTGAQLWNTDRGGLNNIRIDNCTVGLHLLSSLAQWVEQSRINDVDIWGCSIGLKFQKSGTGTGSFGETYFRGSVNNCDVGVDVGLGCDLYRSILDIVIWLNGDQLGVRLNGNLYGVQGSVGIEQLGSSGTGVAVELGADLTNGERHNLSFLFTGSFANHFTNLHSKAFAWKEGGRTFSNTFAHPVEAYAVGQVYPRARLIIAGPAGGALELGEGYANEMVGVYPCYGSPEGSVSARQGSLALRKDGAPGASAYIKEFGNDDIGWTPIINRVKATGWAQLVAGKIQIFTPFITDTSQIFVTLDNPGGTLGTIVVKNIGGTDRLEANWFFVSSSKPDGTLQDLDTSSFNWMIVEPL